MITAILAVSKNNVIGKDGTLPWPTIKEDMIWFKEKTLDQVVVMGSKSWNSPDMPKPLPKRINYVISSKPISNFDGAIGVISGNLVIEISKLAEKYPDKEIMILGGAEIYEQVFPYCDAIYLTRINKIVDGDTSLSVNIDYTLDEWNYSLTYEKISDECTFQIWKGSNSQC